MSTADDQARKARLANQTKIEEYGQMTLNICTLDPTEAEAAFAVITASFNAFVAPDYSEEGRRLFFSIVTPDYLRSLPGKNGFSVVARVDRLLVGICSIRDGRHITLFFVAPEFQGKGIGRRLFDESVLRIRQNAPSAEEIEVHSSPIAVPVYQALGFRVVGDVQDEGGIRYIPMSCPLPAPEPLPLSDS